jgi:hypothetical protein
MSVSEVGKDQKGLGVPKIFDSMSGTGPVEKSRTFTRSKRRKQESFNQDVDFQSRKKKKGFGLAR